MKVLRIKNGHKFNLSHPPKLILNNLPTPKYAGLSFRNFEHLKFKVLAKEGDEVKLSAPLAYPKDNPQINFCAIAGGRVHEIKYGAKRVLEAIIIEIDEALEQEKIDTSKIDIKKFLLEYGYWPLLETFPKMNFAPEHFFALHINMAKREPHSPNNAIILQNNEAFFLAGIKALKTLCPNLKIYINQEDLVLPALKEYAEIIYVENKYPADNIGVQSFYAAYPPNSITVGADTQSIIDIGYHILTGIRRTSHIYSLAGNAVIKPQHYFGRIGIAAEDLIQNNIVRTKDIRVITGSIFRGTKIQPKDFLTTKYTGLQVMLEDKERIPLVFFRPGSDRFTLSKNWLSSFLPNKQYEATTSNNGEERACIQCGYCIDICPVLLTPNLIIKSSINKDIEKMQNLQINDCVDCGLCSFVCPSKIELAEHISKGKQLIEKEG
jgi:Na+-transporting NADH:ubiquinone oxidoreductase subunit A